MVESVHAPDNVRNKIQASGNTVSTTRLEFLREFLLALRDERRANNNWPGPSPFLLRTLHQCLSYRWGRRNKEVPKEGVCANRQISCERKGSLWANYHIVLKNGILRTLFFFRRKLDRRLRQHHPTRFWQSWVKTPSKGPFQSNPCSMDSRSSPWQDGL